MTYCNILLYIDILLSHTILYYNLVRSIETSERQAPEVKPTGLHMIIDKALACLYYIVYIYIYIMYVYVLCMCVYVCIYIYIYIHMSNSSRQYLSQ